jgi:outer membrane protein assembly factor BamE (lipoprotein component of BamABCDE complex)
MKKTIIRLLFLAIFISGCATFPLSKEPVQKSNLTMGTIKTKIIKGKTTQAEVMELLGAPNLVTKNRENNEVWNYNRMSFKAMDGEDSGNLIFWGGSRAVSTTTTQSFDLIIEFDKNDVVKDYSVISASY